jgi:hypothetical protein
MNEYHQSIWAAFVLQQRWTLGYIGDSRLNGSSSHTSTTSASRAIDIPEYRRFLSRLTAYDCCLRVLESILWPQHKVVGSDSPCSLKQALDRTYFLNQTGFSLHVSAKSSPVQCLFHSNLDYMGLFTEIRPCSCLNMRPGVGIYPTASSYLFEPTSSWTTIEHRTIM